MVPAVDDNVRPWGRYDVLAENQGFKVKSITVAAGKRLSYQRHARPLNTGSSCKAAAL